MSLQLPALEVTRRSAVCLGLKAIGAACSRELLAASPVAAVEVGPDQPVGDLRTMQVEPYIAAHPSKPGSLIVSGAEFKEGRFLAKAWASIDTGKSWIAAEIERSGDSVLTVNNWVAYGGDGTAYYAITGHPADGENYIGVYRSLDQGRSWSSGVKTPAIGYDQPRITAGTGSVSNTVYIAAMLAGIAVLRSSDSGASFELVSRVSPSNLGAQPREPLILADGSLLIPFADFPARPEHSLIASRMYVIRSEDGGSLFDHPHFVAEVPRAFLGGGGTFATDPSDGPFRGRIYAAWESGDFGGRIVSWTPRQREESGTRRELSIAYSNNNGRSWSVPKQVSKPGLGPAFMGCLAVAPNGALGALWIQHEKYETNPRSYRAWFAASMDGGDTFTQPQVVSRAVSMPDRRQMEKIDYLQTRYRGGDYIGLAAAADSAFHAVWADARDGAFHIFHASVRVPPK